MKSNKTSSLAGARNLPFITLRPCVNSLAEFRRRRLLRCHSIMKNILLNATTYSISCARNMAANGYKLHADIVRELSSPAEAGQSHHAAPVRQISTKRRKSTNACAHHVLRYKLTLSIIVSSWCLIILSCRSIWVSRYSIVAITNF